MLSLIFFLIERKPAYSHYFIYGIGFIISADFLLFPFDRKKKCQLTGWIFCQSSLVCCGTTFTSCFLELALSVYINLKTFLLLIKYSNKLTVSATFISRNFTLNFCHACNFNNWNQKYGVETGKKNLWKS